MSFRNIAAAAAGALALFISGTASATPVTELTFTTTGAQPTVYFDGYLPGTTTVDPKLHALFTVSLDSVTDNGYQWNFSYQLQNTSTEASRLATIGWDVSPDFETAKNVGGLFGKWAANGNMPILGNLDFCLKSTGGASCAGGGSGGLTKGQSGAGTFSLVFEDSYETTQTVQVPVYNNKGKLIRYDTKTIEVEHHVDAPKNVTFDNFGVHYQSLASGKSTIGVPSIMPGGVPEPATWAMMLTGVFGAGAVLRRRRALALA